MITALRTTPILRVALLAILMVAAFAVSLTLTRHGAAPHIGAIYYHGAKPDIYYHG